MSATPLPALVLFDFDDVLARYAHEERIAHLARSCGVGERLVAEVLFDSGLESDYDGGGIDTATYLGRLGDGLGAPVDEAMWIAARVAGSRVDPAVLAWVRAVATQARIGVLTNNGVLLAEVARVLLPPLFPGLGPVSAYGACRAGPAGVRGKEERGRVCRYATE
ncbi:hydrolase [Luteimonas salinilitoris]|uniref:Hydrolase n=1 Tax=Luteimonas salinilitoris TaxID=3237697 RepID=A0ABV4HS12_9GAMM